MRALKRWFRWWGWTPRASAKPGHAHSPGQTLDEVFDGLADDGALDGYYGVEREKGLADLQAMLAVVSGKTPGEHVAAASESRDHESAVEEAESGPYLTALLATCTERQEAAYGRAKFFLDHLITPASARFFRWVGIVGLYGLGFLLAGLLEQAPSRGAGERPGLPGELATEVPVSDPVSLVVAAFQDLYHRYVATSSTGRHLGWITTGLSLLLAALLIQVLQARSINVMDEWAQEVGGFGDHKPRITKTGRLKAGRRRSPALLRGLVFVCALVGVGLLISGLGRSFDISALVIGFALAVAATGIGITVSRTYIARLASNVPHPRVHSLEIAGLLAPLLGICTICADYARLGGARPVILGVVAMLLYAATLLGGLGFVARETFVNWHYWRRELRRVDAQTTQRLRIAPLPQPTTSAAADGALAAEGARAAYLRGYRAGEEARRLAPPR